MSLNIGVAWARITTKLPNNFPTTSHTIIIRMIHFQLYHQNHPPRREQRIHISFVLPHPAVFGVKSRMYDRHPDESVPGANFAAAISYHLMSNNFACACIARVQNVRFTIK